MALSEDQGQYTQADTDRRQISPQADTNNRQIQTTCKYRPRVDTDHRQIQITGT